MELLLKRQKSSDKATLGELYIDGVFACFTLEDVVRDLKPDGTGKVQDDTAIGDGRYQVIIDFSQRFQKLMLHVLNVKWFTGIRIHSGNTDHDTKGCILVGTEVVNTDFVHGGSVALPILFTKIQAALAHGEEVWLTITPAA